MYSATWGRKSEYQTMSPGCTWASGTCGNDEYCEEAEWGRYTPACAQAQDVRPEQSKALGPAAPKTYGVPITDLAASIAIWAPVAFGFGTKPPPPPPSVGGGGEVTVVACCWAASRARCCAS